MKIRQSLSHSFVKFALASLFLLFSISGIALAQDFENKQVSSVDIRFDGAQTVDEARLRGYIQLTSGSKYKSDTIDTDIKSLYDSGLVNDVRVFAEPAGNSVRVIYEISAREGVVAIGFVGNSVFSDTKLAKASKVTAGGALSDQAIVEARNNIESYYSGYGYPDVSITTRIQSSETGSGSELIFIIDEGEKNEIRRILFEGNNTFDSRTLRRQMKLKRKGLFSFLTKSGRFEVDQLDEDLEAVLDYYRTKGYLRASSPGIRREPVGDGRRVDLVIPIDEGEKYSVSNVAFGHMSVYSPEELYPAMTLRSGDAYNSRKVRADITTIRNYYGSRGYADAAVTPDIRDAGPNQVNVIYRISEGSRFLVGNVNIQGNTKTQDKVIRREVPLKPGDNFNSVEMETTKTRLQGLQYFDNVQVDSSISARGGNYRDVDILVNERRTGSVSVGAGFSSIDNLVGFLSLEQSNFDIRNPWNFTGAGQRFAMELRLGSRRTDFSISLTEPWFMGRQLAVGGELFYSSNQYYSSLYEQTNVGGAINVRKPLTEHTYITGQYRIENIKIDVEPFVRATATNPVPSLLIPEHGNYTRSALSGSWVYDSRDAVIETREGHKIEIGAQLAGGPLGGDVDIFGMNVTGQKYWNLRWDSILSVNGELAFVEATSGRVPIFDRMFLGGARTLRGFDFRDVGPRDAATNEVIGGTSLGYAQIEYSVPVIDNVRIAAFYDAGFVNSSSDIYSDIGIGVRLRLPVSPVPLALDYAVPVSTPDKRADDGGRFQFSLQYQY